MCEPCPHPEKPDDYPISMMTGIKNMELIGREGLGFSWMRSNRLSVMYHFSLMGILKFIAFDIWNKKAFKEKLELLVHNSNN